MQVEAGLRQELKQRLTPSCGLEDGLAKYLSEYAIHLKSYRGQISKARRLRPFLTDRTFDDIPQVVKELKTLPRTPATINRLLAILRRICTLAHAEWKWLPSPIKISLLPERNQRHIYLTRDQVAKLVRACHSKGAKDAILLAVYTGMRWSELLSIGEDNVRDGFIYLGNTKTGKPRAVPLHPKLSYIRLPLETTDALLRQEFNAGRKSIKMPWLHFHDLRHTFASWLIQNGVELYTVGKILGHTETQTTARYSHLRDDDLSAAVGKIRVTRGVT